MNQLKKSFILLILLTLAIASKAFAQGYFSFNRILYSERAKQVIQDNEYTSTGHEQGKFFSNPLMLNEKHLDYDAFSLESEGELTVVKATATGQTTKVPFYVYLRRGGNKVAIPEMEIPDPDQTKIDISEILRYAEPGDHLVIQPINKEDGPAKRILKLLGNGC